MFINWVNVIRPILCPESLRQPTDNSHTPSRLPTDTTKYGTFWPIRGNWDKRKLPFSVSHHWCDGLDIIFLYFSHIEKQGKRRRYEGAHMLATVQKCRRQICPSTTEDSTPPRHPATSRHLRYIGTFRFTPINPPGISWQLPIRRLPAIGSQLAEVMCTNH